jgi:hypothetical protein
MYKIVQMEAIVVVDSSELVWRSTDGKRPVLLRTSGVAIVERVEVVDEVGLPPIVRALAS